MSVVQNFKFSWSSSNPMFIIKFTINRWTCPLMFYVQLLEYHSVDRAKR
jgi:hypothetical protein